MSEARPVLAVTMGDPAGIGPEIAVRALLSPEVREMSRSFLIGDARVFERALSVCGLSASLNRIAGPEDIADRPGVIDVIHQQTVDPDKLPMGKVQALGGEAAYAAIRASIELAMAGRVAGVATTPINKESLKAAKIPFIGHTEMFADQTGAREEMTMFTIKVGDPLMVNIVISSRAPKQRLGMADEPSLHRLEQFLVDRRGGHAGDTRHRQFDRSADRRIRRLATPAPAPCPSAACPDRRSAGGSRRPRRGGRRYPPGRRCMPATPTGRAPPTARARTPARRRRPSGRYRTCHDAARAPRSRDRCRRDRRG